MLRTLLAAGAAAVVTIAGAGAAQAMQHVTVSNGVFGDGGTFSGWFDVKNLLLDAPSAWDIVTTGGSTLAGDEYKSGGADQSAFNSFLVGGGVYLAFSFFHGPPSDPDGLGLTLVDPQPGEAIEGQVLCVGCADRTGNFDYQITAVPEPGVWTLTILGLGLAGAALRRRRTLQLFRAPA